MYYIRNHSTKAITFKSNTRHCMYMALHASKPDLIQPQYILGSLLAVSQRTNPYTTHRPTFTFDPIHCFFLFNSFHLAWVSMRANEAVDEMRTFGSQISHALLEELRVAILIHLA